MIDFDKLSPADRELARKHLPNGDRKKMVGKQQGREPSKLEDDFSFHLYLKWSDKDIFAYGRWKVPLQLAGRTTYLPDFWVEEDFGGIITAIEVKGPFERDDGSRIKIKVAARLYPQYRYLWVTRNADGSWTGHEVTAEKGISRKRAEVSWL